MEQKWYIYDLDLNKVLIDNLSHDQAQAWLIENGIASKHVMFEQENQDLKND